jgi:hypothetical protein
MVGSAAQLTVEPLPTQDVLLSARLAAGKVVLAWPVTATGYRLQRAASVPVPAGGWTDDPSPVVENGANWEVSLDPTGAQAYFRLIK